MSIGDSKARPSALQGAHPLVTSRSAPLLHTGSSSPAGSGRTDRPLPEPASPPASPRSVRQLHPAVTTGDASVTTARPDSKHEAKHRAGRAASPESQVTSSQHGRVPAAPGPLVRLVGGFSLAPDPRLEEDNDVLTALVDSIQRSGQQQPDSAMPSSGEGTPRVQPGTPATSDTPDSPGSLPRSRMSSREKTE